MVKSRTAAHVGGHMLMDSQFVAVMFSMSQNFLLNWKEKRKCSVLKPKKFLLFLAGWMATIFFPSSIQ